MRLIKEQELIEKKSRFIGMYFAVSSLEEVVLILENLKKEHRKADHMPYAYKIDEIVRKSDDKEPATTAGNPILNIIEKKYLNNVLIVVIRYYGGIALGAGRLIRTYGKCANLVTS